MVVLLVLSVLLVATPAPVAAGPDFSSAIFGKYAAIQSDYGGNWQVRHYAYS